MPDVSCNAVNCIHHYPPLHSCTLLHIRIGKNGLCKDRQQLVKASRWPCHHPETSFVYNGDGIGCCEECEQETWGAA